jgi:hypothetical protein
MSSSLQHLWGSRNPQVEMEFFTFALIFLLRVDVEKILPLVFFKLLMEKLPLSCL